MPCLETWIYLHLDQILFSVKGPGPWRQQLKFLTKKHVLLDIENYILSLKITQVRYIVQNKEYIIHLTNVN